MDKLAVVIPVYNEEEIICTVLAKWCDMLDGEKIDYRIHAYDDGSRDSSAAKLNDWAAAHPGKVVVHCKANEGHGPTILRGYRELCDTYDWIFQMDSDDEMGTEAFPYFWRARSHFDFLLGSRLGRVQPLPRRMISMVSRLAVHLLYGRAVRDVNAPYRLMRSAAFAASFRRIPADTFAPNVILSGLAARLKLRVLERPVAQQDRRTGEVSIRKWKLFKAAVRSFRQTCVFAFQR